MRSLLTRSLREKAGVALLLGAPALTTMTWSEPAYAQSSEEISGARTLAKKGIAAFNAEDWEKAEDYFRRAESLYHAPSHLLYLARSLVKLGRFVDAAETYNRLAREQLDEKSPAAFRKAQEDARSEVGQLDARFAQVAVELKGDGRDEVKVLANGKEVPAALIGVARPMDPGTYEFSIVSDSKSAQPVSIEVGEGEEKTVVLKLEAGSSPAIGAGAPSSAGGTGGDVAADGGTKGAPVFAYTALGVGVVGLGLGTFFTVSHFRDKSDAQAIFDDENCANDNQCSRRDRDDVLGFSESAATNGTLAVISYGVGAAALGTGVVLLLTRGKKSEETAVLKHGDLSVRPVLGFRSLGLSGQF